MVYDRTVQNTKLRYFCKARCALFSLAISNFLEKLGENYIKSPRSRQKIRTHSGIYKILQFGVHRANIERHTAHLKLRELIRNT